MTVFGVVLLVAAIAARGRGAPPAWYPQASHWLPKVLLAILPIFAILALVAGVAPLVVSDKQEPGPFGLIYIVLLVALVVFAVIRLPRWLMPQWLRQDIDDKAERLKRNQS